MIAHWPHRHPGFVFATLALILLGSLFPRGYMPIRDDGRITVTLCSAYGERTIEIDTGRKSPPSQHVGSTNCWGVFAGGPGLLPTALPSTAPAIDWPAEKAPPEAPRLIVAGLFHFDPNAPPQAPPLSIS